MSRITLTICMALALTFAAYSTAAAIEFKKDDFSIVLPNGWKEIPRDIMDANEKELSRVAPNFRVQHIDHGFQLASANRWFEYPYISVKIHRTGRLPESQLEKLQEYSAESNDKYKEALGSMLSSIQTEKMLFDKQRKIIWMRLQADVANVGPISGISGMVLTEMGFIQVTGVTLIY